MDVTKINEYQRLAIFMIKFFNGVDIYARGFTDITYEMDHLTPKDDNAIKQFINLKTKSSFYVISEANIECRFIIESKYVDDLLKEL